MNKLVKLVIHVFVMLCNLIIYSYVKKLENNNCVCSQDHMRDTIKAVSLFAVVLACVNIPLAFTDSKKGLFSKYKYFLKFLGFLSLFYTIMVTVYYFKLTYSRCECSKKPERYLLLYPIMINIIFNVFIIISS